MPINYPRVQLCALIQNQFFACMDALHLGPLFAGERLQADM